MASLIPTSEAAPLLGVSTRTLRRWARDGTLPPVQRLNVGHGYFLFSRPQVERLARRLARTRAERRMVL